MLPPDTNSLNVDATRETTAAFDVTDIRTYVVSLPRRPDRRERMRRMLPTELCATYTSDWQGPFDGHHLDRVTLDDLGYRLHPWQLASENPWWSRPLKLGEIACTLAHRACWQHAADSGREPFVLILEDDAVVGPDFLGRLLEGLAQLRSTAQVRPFGLLYLGRVPLGSDQTASPGFVKPGYSHCTFGYLLTRPAVTTLLAARVEHAIVPVDELLPALYIDHPRPDLRTRFPQQLSALAFQPPLVTQLPKDEAGSDTEDSAFVDW